MEDSSDPALASLFGSRTRLLTMAVLANAEQPMSGYRVAKVAGLPRQKVYPEIRRGVDAGLVVETPSGFRLADADVRALLRKRVRIRWTEDWDRARAGRSPEVTADLRRIRASLKGVRTYEPKNRIPSAALRELERDPAKDQILRRMGARPSLRKG
ncbi:MAG: hypothetical protein WB947_07370 [Thermoplasmata archaeon]